jgi:hypothetical protein
VLSFGLVRTKEALQTLESLIQAMAKENGKSIRKIRFFLGYQVQSMFY